jgi:hypothetical protein
MPLLAIARRFSARQRRRKELDLGARSDAAFKAVVDKALQYRNLVVALLSLRMRSRT